MLYKCNITIIIIIIKILIICSVVSVTVVRKMTTMVMVMTIALTVTQLTWRGGAAESTEQLLAAEEKTWARCFSPAEVMALPARLRWVRPFRSGNTVTSPASPPSPSWLSVAERERCQLS